MELERHVISWSYQCYSGTLSTWARCLTKMVDEKATGYQVLVGKFTGAMRRSRVLFLAWGHFNVLVSRDE